MTGSLWEYVVVILAVAVSAAFVGRRFRRTAKGVETTCGCEGGCPATRGAPPSDSCPARGAPSPPTDSKA